MQQRGVGAVPTTVLAVQRETMCLLSAHHFAAWGHKIWRAVLSEVMRAMKSVTQTFRASPPAHLLALLRGHLPDLVVAIDNAQDIEQLALVLMDALDLDIQQGIRVDSHACKGRKDA